MRAAAEQSDEERSHSSVDVQLGAQLLRAGRVRQGFALVARVGETP